jgi:hypothetical protein
VFLVAATDQIAGFLVSSLKTLRLRLQVRDQREFAVA